MREYAEHRAEGGSGSRRNSFVPISTANIDGGIHAACAAEGEGASADIPEIVEETADISQNGVQTRLFHLLTAQLLPFTDDSDHREVLVNRRTKARGRTSGRLNGASGCEELGGSNARNGVS